MNERPRIGIDLDGVLIDHNEHRLQLAREFGYEIEPWQVNTNVMKDLMPDVYRVIQDRLYARLTETAPVAAGALEAIAAVPADFYIVSSRTPVSIRFAQDWLGKYRFYDYIPAERVLYCGSADDKRSYCQRFRLDFFMDDKLSLLQKLPPTTRCLLFDQDGIAGRIDVSDDIDVVTGWDEFRRLALGE